jgi:nitroreductase
MIKNEIKEALDWRYATKKMNPLKKISSEDWQILKDSLRLAPSSYGLQPWKFVVVQNPALRTKLREVSWGQAQVEDASHFIVFTAKDVIDEKYIRHFIEDTAKTRNIPASALDGYRDLMITNIGHKPTESHKAWNQRQCYIAMGFLLETASLLKIDTVPLEGIEPEKYDEILGLAGTGYSSVAAVALGYRHEEDAYQNLAKARFDESVIFDVRE